MFRSRLNNIPEVEADLRRLGLRITAPRRAILEELSGDTTHPTANALFERVRARYPGVAFATVYNTLSALARAGYVDSLALGGATRFDPLTEPHDHLVCRRCGEVQDLEPQGIERIPAELQGFSVDRVERVYRGICSRCQSS